MPLATPIPVSYTHLLDKLPFVLKEIIIKILSVNNEFYIYNELSNLSVSYTHLDVYKRQVTNQYFQKENLP